MTEQKKHPIVMRMEGMTPDQLAGYETHRKRRGGDLGHVDAGRSHLNKRLIGDEDWARQALAEIAEMRAENFAGELEALERRKRQKDLRARMVEGPRDPWRPSRHGPMREIILTAHSDWFASDPALQAEDGSIDALFGATREELFEEHAVAWLRETFGDDVIHARADRDEAAYHIHAVILPRATLKDGRKMLQPSIHPVIKDYEAGQDSVGTWFADLGLARGARQAQAIREARAKGETPPSKRKHARTAKWRAEQELALQRREDDVTTREAEAEAVIAVAAAIETGSLTVEGSKLRVTKTATPEERAVLAETLKASPRGFDRARHAFAAAWQRLAGAAKKKADAQARADLADAFDQVRKADDIIVAAANLLPISARRKITAVRSGLSARILAVSRHLRDGGKSRSEGVGKPENGKD